MGGFEPDKLLEPIGDDLKRERSVLSGAQKGHLPSISGKVRRREPAVPMMDGYGAAIANTKNRRLVQEGACERTVPT